MPPLLWRRTGSTFSLYTVAQGLTGSGFERNAGTLKLIYVTKELPNLNHLFQECTTGSPNEYAEIEQTFAPSALLEISNWILEKVN